MKLSVIIPVYRGKEILKELVIRINKTLIGKYDFEVLFICDGCDDTSLRILKEIKKNLNRIEIYMLAQNYGQHRAILFGFVKASGDYFITMDEDLQHDPDDIIKLIEKQQEKDYDIVYGRFLCKKHNVVKNIFSEVLRKIMTHLIPTLYFNYSPYRLIKRDVAKSTSSMVCPYTFIDDLLSKVTKNIAFIDIIHHERLKGHSSYSIVKILKNGLYIILAYSKLNSWLFAIACLFITVGLFLFSYRIVYDGDLIKNLIYSKTTLRILETGLIFLIISSLGTFINRRNLNKNMRQIKLSNEDSI